MSVENILLNKADGGSVFVRSRERECTGRSEASLPLKHSSPLLHMWVEGNDPTESERTQLCFGVCMCGANCYFVYLIQDRPEFSEVVTNLEECLCNVEVCCDLPDLTMQINSMSEGLFSEKAYILEVDNYSIFSAIDHECVSRKF